MSDERTQLLERHKYKLEKRWHWIQEKRDDEHNEQRQREASEKIKCPQCHEYIAEKFIRTVYDITLFRRGNDHQCMCERPALVLQMRRFLLHGVYYKVPTVIAGVRFPNGSVALGIRIIIDPDEALPCQDVFPSLGKLKEVLDYQTHIRDWSIEWIDEENNQW